MKRLNLLVLKSLFKRKYVDNRVRVFAKCLCDCGRKTTTQLRYLLSGHTRSCGCVKKSHGLSGSRTYKSYTSMLQRCLNPHKDSYHNYGGRGIRVHRYFRLPDGQGFLNFFEEVGKRPSIKHSIDRIDNDGNYTPGNIRWATSKMQARNRRKSTHTK